MIRNSLIIGLTLVGVWLVYRLVKILSGAGAILRDYFVLWQIAFGAHPSRRTMGKTMRQHAYVCATHLLDDVSINELYEFCKSMIQSEITIESFHKIVLGYTFAVMCRERIDGSLRGMYLMSVERKEDNGEKYTVIKIGLALVKNCYRGGPLMYYVFLWHALRELILHPRTPIYLMGKAFSYLSYITLIRYLQKVYPRHDRQTPERERNLMNQFANDVRIGNEIYDPDTFVLKRELSNLKSHVAPISDSDLENPHIRFFADSNPGWQSGHCMFFIAKVSLSDAFSILWKSIKRARKGRKNSTTGPVRPARYSRALSFQEEMAQRYVIKHCELDLMGNMLLRKSSIATVVEENDDYDELDFDD